MRFITALLAATLLTLGGCSGNLVVPAKSLAQPTSPMGKSICLVVGRYEDDKGVVVGNGTAFATIWRGQTGLMTAWHVAKKKRSLEINGNGYHQLCGPFNQIGDRDVAFFAMKLPPQWVPLLLATEEVNYGAVVAWGFPYTEGALVGNPGVDKGPSKFSSDREHVIREVTGIAIPGMSGGPLIVMSGKNKGRVFALVSTTGWPTSHVHYPVLIPK